MAGCTYRFGPFRLDAADRVLLRGQDAVQLTPKALDHEVAPFFACISRRARRVADGPSPEKEECSMLRLTLSRPSMYLLALTLAFMTQASGASEVGSGRKLFEKSCGACHGENAQGGRGPSLTGEMRHGASDEEILHNILNGIPGTGMPPFPMPDEEARAIVAYLR